MGYYMGDYYSGYRGDPGFFSFLGGLAKKAVGFIPGVGPAISAGLSAVTGAAKSSSIVQRAYQVSAPIVSKGVAIASKHPVLTAAGAAGVAGMTGAAATMIAKRGSKAGAGMAAPMAMHGGRRRRRMNVCNPKALRRSIRRTHAFAKLAMKTIHLVHPKKHATFGGFKKRRRK